MEGRDLRKEPARLASRAVSALRQVGGLIKFSHSIFALPFAIIGYMLASCADSAGIACRATSGHPPLGKLVFILLAMVGARSSAMAFNRIVDRDLDRLNPRTSDRHLPTGRLPVWAAWTVVVVGAVVLVGSAAALNRLALLLSPVALLVVLGYSYSKRFTSLSHLWLGLSLAIAPAGAWVGVRGDLTFLPCLLAAAVLFWTAGFDIIYSTQDVEFDVSMRLYSVPARFGLENGLRLAGISHALCVLFLVLVGSWAELGWLYYGGVALCTLILAYEHSIVKPTDLSRVNTAFFTLNGVVSIVLMVVTACDLYGARW